MELSPEVARGFTGENYARTLEAAARADAANGRDGYHPPSTLPAESTYMDRLLRESERFIYHAQFAKRVARNERKK